MSSADYSSVAQAQLLCKPGNEDLLLSPRDPPEKERRNGEETYTADQFTKHLY